jgi:ABC-type bacteriocin/lantibiotic exporter with double-glycine peptidase domain
LVDLSGGKILTDKVDIATIGREELRERLISISQDPVIISGTVRNKANPLGTSTDEDIVTVLHWIGIRGSLESRGDFDAALLDNPPSITGPATIILPRQGYVAEV